MLIKKILIDNLFNVILRKKFIFGKNKIEKNRFILKDFLFGKNFGQFIIQNLGYFQKIHS